MLYLIQKNFFDSGDRPYFYMEKLGWSKVYMKFIRLKPNFEGYFKKWWKVHTREGENNV